MQTTPHSPTGYAVEAGVLDESAALHHEDRHVISNFVGMSGMHLEVGPSVPVGRRDTLLFASDGLADNLRLDEIVQRIRKGPLLAAARGLVTLARERMDRSEGKSPSKPDDLTVVLFRRTS
jgi:serine/threonine protein phosphatase PrpC